MATARRAFAGAAVQTTISGAITGTSLSITINSATGWPSGAEFYAVLDPGTASEEKILCTRSGTTLTCASTAKRGVDGTVAASHSSGAAIYPCIAAADLDEANALAATATTEGDIAVLGTTAWQRLGVGSNGLPLVVNTAVSGKLNYAQLGTAGIADDAITSAKIATGAVGSSEIATDAVGSDEIAAGAVGTAELADGAVTAGKLAASITSSTVPAGVVVSTVAASAPTGWLLMIGQAVATADSLYPELWSVVPAGWKSGTTLNLPDMRDRGVVGAGTTYTLGSAYGANSVTISSANLPTHTHTVDHDHTSVTSGGPSNNTSSTPSTNNTSSEAAHTHGAGTYGTSSDGSHQHGPGSGSAFLTNTAGGATLPGGATVEWTSYTALAGTHSHSVSGTSQAGSAHSHDLQSHTHTLQNHTHAVDVGAFTGNSGNGGFANTALSTLPSVRAFNWIIKAH